jgi:hypothetical protein
MRRGIGGRDLRVLSGPIARLAVVCFVSSVLWLGLSPMMGCGDPI